MKVLLSLAATSALAAGLTPRVSGGGQILNTDCCSDNSCTSGLLRIRTTTNNGFVESDIRCPSVEGEGHNEVQPPQNIHNGLLSRFVPWDYEANAANGGVFENPVRTEVNGAANPRAISNALHQATADIRSAAGLTDMVTFWGQFLDHDIGESLMEATESFPIDIPIGDPQFDPLGAGGAQLPLDRSLSQVDADNVRQQENFLTGWIDASNVYGEEFERTEFLRSFQNGELRSIIINGEEFPPFNAENPADQFMNANQGGLVDPATLFVAGDQRANEQPTLLVMHTLMLREHNWHANRIRYVFPEAEDDEIFQLARRFVIAESQVVTYTQWLDALAGPGLLGPYQGHDPNMDASLFNYFPHACFRIGHSLLNDVQTRLDEYGAEHPALNAALADGFFNPQVVWAETGLTPYLRGLSVNVAQEMDTELVDAVRNLLFGNLGFENGDLAALNIQRAREHGIAGYEASRRAFGLATYDDWSDVTSNLFTAFRLHTAFGAYPEPCPADCDAPTDFADRGVDCCLLGGTTTGNNPARQVDPWSVSLAEDHVNGGNLGSLNHAAFREVFTRFREGDFFHYLNPDYLLPQQREYVERQTLSDIALRNSDAACYPDNVFVFDPEFDFHSCA